MPDTKKISIFFLVLFVFFILGTSLAFAAGIVPCGNSENNTPCTICHLIKGVSNLVNYGKNILVVVAIAGIVTAGIIYMMSSGSESMITLAKNCFRASIIGFAITIAAWLLINTVLFWILPTSSNLGVGVIWYTFDCDTTSSATNSSGTTTTKTEDTANSNLADCKKECDSSGKSGTELTSCYNDCASQAQDAKEKASSVASAAKSMKDSGCAYSQTQRNDCATDPKYTDCGQLACDSLKSAGYNTSSLGNCSSINTAALYSKASTYSGNTSDLKAGDIIVRNDGTSGHAAICENDGCSTITHAAGQNKGIVTGANNYMLKQNIKVIHASSL